MRKSPSSSSHNFISNTAKLEMFTNLELSKYSFISQLFGVVGSFREKLDFFSILGFDIQFQKHSGQIKKTPQNQALIYKYLHSEKLIHAQETVTI